MAMDMGHICVLGIDPGETTGWCVMGVDRAALSGPNVNNEPLNKSVINGIFKYGQIDCFFENNGVQELLDLALIDYPASAIAMEDFILNFRKADMARHTLSPIRVMSKFEYGLWSYEEHQVNRIFLQAASLAKTTCTDERLKEWKFYDRHSGVHARDAVRHAYYFLRSIRGNTLDCCEKRWQAYPNLYSDPQFKKPVLKTKKLPSERIYSLG
jgi:hypothetical protein